VTKGLGRKAMVGDSYRARFEHKTYCPNYTGLNLLHEITEAEWLGLDRQIMNVENFK
jgi:hypothetical protein